MGQCICLHHYSLFYLTGEQYRGIIVRLLTQKPSAVHYYNGDIGVNLTKSFLQSWTSELSGIVFICKLMLFQFLTIQNLTGFTILYIYLLKLWFCATCNSNFIVSYSYQQQRSVVQLLTSFSLSGGHKFHLHLHLGWQWVKPPCQEHLINGKGSCLK